MRLLPLFTSCLLALAISPATFGADTPVATPTPVVSAIAPADHSAELDAYIAQGIKDWNLPGLSIVIVKDDQVVYLKGFGSRSIDQAGTVDADTLFGMMSTTKALTSLSLAMLVDEGKVGWDDPVTKYLPWFRMPEPYVTEHLTVRDLLRHNAGLGNADALWTRDDLSTREILERVRYLKPAYSLRDSFVYQNVMYQVAGEVVTAASGLPWEQFVATRIFKPLGMTRSYPTLARMREKRDGDVSSAHFEIDGVLHRIEENPVDSVPACGAAWSNARDMAKWLRFLLAGGIVDGKRLVSETNFRELFAPQALVPASEFYPTMALTKPHWTSYGLGWFQQDYRGRFVAMHTGSMDGRIAIIGLMPDEHLGVYVFGNADHVEFRHALMWKVFDLYTDAPARDWSAEFLKLYGDQKKQAKQAEADQEAKRIADTQPSRPLADYAGTYTHPAWGDVVVTADGNGLQIRFGAGAQNLGRLEHFHYDTFRTRFGDGRYGWSYLKFELTLNGKVSSVSFDGSDEYRFVRQPN